MLASLLQKSSRKVRPDGNGGCESQPGITQGAWSTMKKPIDNIQSQTDQDPVGGFFVARKPCR